MTDTNNISPSVSLRAGPSRESPYSEGVRDRSLLYHDSPGEDSRALSMKSSSAASLSSSDGEVIDLKKLKDIPKMKTRKEEVPLLPGESTQPIIEQDVTYLCPFKPVRGFLAVTNYKLFFCSNDKSGAIQERFEVPLGVVSRVEKVGGVSSRGENAYGIEIQCKDLRHLRFACKQENHSRRKVFEYLQYYSFPATNELRFFAFEYKERFPKNGWTVYNPVEELKRMGVPNDMWRMSHINDDYQFCESYPSVFAVPKEASDDDLRQVASFRSRARIPILCWLHPESGASITRASQPLVGLGKRSHSDEELLKVLQETNPHSNKIFIMDARPNVNAVANKARGGGYESEDSYKNAELIFLDIHNIHVMRESLRKLKDICYPEIDDSKWLSNLEATHWMDHIRQILSGAVRVADKVECHKNSVLVHCSDGWDRTSQLTALAMLMLDPYYRTLKGFQVLIEQEWTSAGHKFAQRVGHGDDKHSDSERSPVFVQFIDCVWQMTQQFENAFEFNDQLLIFILDHLYSCKYGTFLFNSERERKIEGVFDETRSLWSEVNSSTELYLNPFYSAHSVQHAIFPVASPRYLRLWKSYYVRWNTRMRPQENLPARLLQLLSARSRLEQSLQDVQLKAKAHTMKGNVPNPSGLVSPSVQV